MKDKYKEYFSQQIHNDTFISTKESDYYRAKIEEMLQETYDTKFLRQIYTIIKKHKEKV